MFAVSIGTLAAFQMQPSLPASRLRVNMQAEAVPSEPTEPIPPPPPLRSVMRVGDGTLAGDLNFDPMGLADSSEKLTWYREAEVKHARLAMLAAVGFPIAEKLNGPLSEALGLPSLLQSGRAPSLVNGGLDQVALPYWLAVIGGAIWIEAQGLDKQFDKKDSDYLPGMLGFDPLGMDSQKMRGAEITNGRIAMIAITGFVLEEAITKAPVVADTPFFFQPIWQSLGF